ncbi:hypothetical protein AB6A40_011665 [Gnathostoma spinigerum]|uniref:F54D1.6-like second Ig-like domain-containing protein n=1 Tax=Gnathostoma spinigerum TaxID=75299 RepID=A0ABD6F3C6_9BILA
MRTTTDKILPNFDLTESYPPDFRESRFKIKKFRPDYRTLCRLATYTNEGSLEYRFKPQEEKIDLNKVEEWYLDEWERDNLLYKFRFGYLKLAPISPPRSTDNNAFVVRPGLVSAPIGLQWLWPLAKGIPISATSSPREQAERLKFVEKKATEMCHEW